MVADKNLTCTISIIVLYKNFKSIWKIFDIILHILNGGNIILRSGKFLNAKIVLLH